MVARHRMRHRCSQDRDTDDRCVAHNYFDWPRMGYRHNTKGKLLERCTKPEGMSMSLEESLLHLRLVLRGGGMFAAALSIVCRRIKDTGWSNCECLETGKKKCCVAILC
jgi:hypothetical protein